MAWTRPPTRAPARTRAGFRPSRPPTHARPRCGSRPAPADRPRPHVARARRGGCGRAAPLHAPCRPHSLASVHIAPGLGEASPPTRAGRRTRAAGRPALIRCQGLVRGPPCVRRRTQCAAGWRAAAAGGPGGGQGWRRRRGGRGGAQAAAEKGAGAARRAARPGERRRRQGRRQVCARPPPRQLPRSRGAGR